MSEHKIGEEYRAYYESRKIKPRNDKKMSEPLKPCPFCGGVDVGVEDEPVSEGWAHIYCHGCGASFSQHEELARTIKRWNTRKCECDLICDEICQTAAEAKEETDTGEQLESERVWNLMLIERYETALKEIATVYERWKKGTTTPFFYLMEAADCAKQALNKPTAEELAKKHNIEYSESKNAEVDLLGGKRVSGDNK